MTKGNVDCTAANRSVAVWCGAVNAVILIIEVAITPNVAGAADQPVECATRAKIAAIDNHKVAFS